MNEEKENWFGRTLIIKEQVVCNDEDEDLKLFKECCEHVCKMYAEIQKDKENKPHPWAEFLKARINAILWMKDEMGRDDKLIANQLSMDERQVYLIRTYAEKERGKENG